MASRSTFPVEYLSAAEYETHCPSYSESELTLPSTSNSGASGGVQFDMSALTENTYLDQAEPECDETAVSLHDFFIHHIPAPTASEQVVRDWIKSWFVGTTAGTHQALNTSAELPRSSLHSIDMKRLEFLRLNGFSIRELTEKAVELHLKNVLLPEGIAAAIAADIQRAKRIEVEVEEKLIAEQHIRDSAALATVPSQYLPGRSLPQLIPRQNRLWFSVFFGAMAVGSWMMLLKQRRG